MIHIIQHQLFILVGLVALFGFYLGALARKVRLPSLIGFMILGVFFGPSGVGFFTEENMKMLSFITEIALGFVALGIGAELSISSLRRLGRGIISIILAESFGAFIVVGVAVYLLTKSLPLALLFGSVAPASAPAGTVAVIQEYRAKGSLTKALYAVVGFDDGLAILIFGFSSAIAKVLLLNQLNVSGTSQNILTSMLKPTIEIVASIIVGTIMGFIFCQLVRRLESGRDMLIMTVAVVFITTGISIHYHLSLILTNMVVGFVLVNTRRESFVHKVTAPLQEIMPLVFLLFFSLAGAQLHLNQLPHLGFVGILYIVSRSVGLIGGARLGAVFGHVEKKIKKYVGWGILSQAGVAIGLSLVIRHDFAQLANNPDVVNALNRFSMEHAGMSRVLYDPTHIGAAMITTITATCIFFEIIGPIMTKIALKKAGEIPENT